MQAYQRGFLLTATQQNREGWETISLPNGTFFTYDPLTPVDLVQDGARWLLVFGDMIDIRETTRNRANVIGRLNGQASNEFHESLDFMGGRYLLIRGDQSSVRLYHDATGMRGVYFTTETPLRAASHLELLQEDVQSGPHPLCSDELRQHNHYHLPGHFTIYESIRILVPNHFVDESNRMTRYYPRRPLDALPVEAALEPLRTWFDNQLHQLFESDERMIFSLTAGIDSRLSLALLKPFLANIETFTYQNVAHVESLDIDAEVATAMARDLQFNHRIIPVDGAAYERSEEAKPFRDMMKRSVTSNHGHAHAYEYMKLYKDRPTRHLRSNILEIGRAFYRKNRTLPAEFTVEGAIRCYSWKSREDERVVSLWTSYVAAVGLTTETLYGYDPYDLLYWEYRMGVWHQQVLAESDVAFETYIPFNARAILELFLTPEFGDRLYAKLFYEVIGHEWPVLAFWGVNKRDTMRDYLHPTLDQGWMALNGVITSGRLDETTIPLNVRRLTTNVSYHLEANAMRKGDHMAYSQILTTKSGQTYRLNLNVLNPFEKRSSLGLGRMRYEIWVGGVLYLSEDIAAWGGPNQVWVEFDATDDATELVVRTVALRDCGPNKWGAASKMQLEALCLQEIEHGHLKAGASSPFTQLHELVETE
ncbi:MULTISPECIES: hypothetical protein [Exiguobacterium]|uniref:hypothetical protein n=1 Tax=Exiguobacterium TaxID=33986 RepID=UPI001BE945CD|nr:MULTISPECIES: hypothetical protein [Exiguobacterium]MCT4777845.1 hypothetical protein [Exiguobacterium aquaticum]MCT4788973.1 hypothetical protein [Exiguobacterium mexicanum]